MRSALVVQRVRQFLSEGRGVPAEEGAAVAKDYAELCRQANERLRTCADYMRRGMVSEALRIAESEPVLLDLCAELDFVGVEDWAAACGTRRWPAPEMIDAKAVHALNEAYSSGASLEPLLRQFRRAVRESKTHDCIRLLGLIAAVDKDNPTWVADIKSFESRRQGEIKSELDEAVRREDSEKLSALAVEVGGAWSIAVETGLRDAVRQAARAVYEKQALVRGKALLRDLATGYAALDFDRVGAALTAYDALVVDGFLKPDASMQTQYDEAREWFDGVSREREQDRQFEEQLAALSNAVEAGQGANIEETLDALARFSRPLPEQLEERAKRLLEAHKLHLERVRRRWLTIGAVAAVITIMAALAIASRARFEAEKKALSASMERAWDAEDAQELGRLLASTEREHARLSSDGDIQVFRSRMSELVARIERKRTAYKTAVETLAALRDGGFQEQAEVIEGLIAEARNNLVAGDPTQNQLSSLLQDWQAHKDKVRGEAEQRADAGVDALYQALRSILGTNATPVKVDEGVLTSLRQKASEVGATTEALSAAARARLLALESRLDTMLAESMGRKKQGEAIHKARTIREYLDALATYARAFPTDNMSKFIPPVVALGENYSRFMEPPHASNAGNLFWYAVYRDREDAARQTRENWPDVKARLLDLKSDVRLSDMYQYFARVGWVYVEGKPVNLRHSEGVEEFEAMCYAPADDDSTPTFAIQTIRTLRYTPMAHCEYVRGLVSMARFSDETRAVDDLMDQIQKLYVTNGVNPLLKGRLTEMLVGMLTELVGDKGLYGWSGLQTSLQEIDPELHWLCTGDPDVLKAGEKAMAILDTHLRNERLIRQTRFLREVADVCLARPPRWVGYRDLSAGGGPVWKEQGIPPEVWVVRTDPSGVTAAYLAGEMMPEGYKQYMTSMPGEPLFAPSSPTTTRERLLALKKKHGISQTKNLPWPYCWPANFRE